MIYPVIEDILRKIMCELLSYCKMSFYNCEKNNLEIKGSVSVIKNVSEL